jgi:acid phosphatase type 7
MKPHPSLILSLILLSFLACSRSQSQTTPADHPAVDLKVQVSPPFRFVAYGDTRFTDPSDTDASNPVVRRALVQAIAEAHPFFISIGGDISYRGDDPKDWKVWDSETAVWREDKIPVFPALGNHDLSGDKKVALANYFERFPELKNSRYYSVRAANTLILVLDSSLDETSGPQGQWLAQKLDTVPADVDFIFIVLHHPPYTSSSDMSFGGGHSARTPEQLMAKSLETRQPKMRARIIVFAGHVHNYERHEHGGVTYFVTGGGAAHPYLINRRPDDLFQAKGVNYHYLLVEVEPGKVKITMNRLDMSSGKAAWTQPDSVTIAVSAAAAAKAGAE